MRFDPESDFPNLKTEGYEVTSRATMEYNCVAWVFEEDDRWWWPDPNFDYHWPTGVPRVETLEAFEAALMSLGYSACDSLDFESDVIKIVIYVGLDGSPTHAARQLPSGRWTSKLGSDVDIEHTSVDSLNGPKYGEVALIMKCPLSTP